MTSSAHAAPPGDAPLKQRYYYKHLGDLKRRLGVAIPRDELRDLHKVDARRHFLVAGRHVAVFFACAALLWQSRWPWIWPIAAMLQGFNCLGFLILVHEQVHKVIFAKSRPLLERILGLLYALPTGISISQFERWHIDHHNELGHDEHDPKRAHLSPKKNSRWLKMLYMTPALFVIYARASRKEAATYPEPVQSRIRGERIFTALVHLAVAGGIFAVGGGWVLLRVYIVPFFFCFPPAFVLNRLGQHYDIDPSDPAKWSTRVDGNRIWHTLFLWSNFHAEHHFYQRVPFYNLTDLNRKLHPFYRDNDIQSRTYREMMHGWMIENKQAHTDWHA
ncbi:MAG: fatty acid desaturase [Acidobacteriota bacterium]